MHEYDIALKSVIRRLSVPVLEALTGFAIERWHNVEMPEVRALRADMIGESAAGDIVHLELQSTNDADMALRTRWPCTGSSGNFPDRWCSTWEKSRFA